MTTFKYHAISKSGAQVTGVVEAYNEYEAVFKIKETHPIVTKLETVVPSVGSSAMLTPAAIKHKSLAMVCSQFAIILSAGLPLVRAVELVAEQTDDKALKRILRQASADVSSGYSLAQSFESNGKALPVTFIETIRAGEESGTLEECFKKLQVYYEKSAKIKAKIISSMIYPAFLLATAIIVITVIMLVTVPMFTKMFASMKTELPFATKILIMISDFMTKYGLYMFVAILAVVLGFRVYSATEDGRIALAKFKLGLPVIGRIWVMQGASQFANTMATLLNSGMPMVSCVAITSKVLSNFALALDLAATLPNLEEGKSLAECMAKSPHFPDLLVEMTSVGEETGSLEDTLRVIGEYYDNEVDISTTKALSVLEPAITMFMAVVVAIVLLAVYLPMFTMYGSFKV